MCPAGSTFRHAFCAKPPSPQKPVAGYRLVGIFGAGWEMAAAMADETRQGQLIEADETRAEDAARCAAPRAVVIAGA